MMSDWLSLSEAAGVVKDLTLTGALVWALRGVMNRTWVPGTYYDDQIKRAEKAEATAVLAHDAADRAIRVSETLAAAVREQGHAR
jgi:hypothetical protein